MQPPNDRAVLEWVIQSLAEGRQPGEIEAELVERFGMDRHLAEVLVQQVESRDAREIELRRNPLLMFFSGIALVGGTLLLVMGLSQAIPRIAAAITAGQSFASMAETSYLAILQILIGLGLIAAGAAALKKPRGC
ncbi:MAG: hypothetical protein HY835_10630 [Anaerolineae bacterium]|nr:hypothetical protein [Anaerolineae bacterium]